MSSKYNHYTLNKYLAIAWLTLSAALTSPVANANIQSEEIELKAAFIYNFSLFTTWPQAKDNLSFCVLGEGGYVEALAKYEGRKALSATIHVQQISAVDELRTCEVLFIDLSENARMPQIHQALKGLPVLTVAEYGILEPPGVMILLVHNHNRVAFEINQNSAKSAGLTLSYKLLKLAHKVK